MAMHVTFYTNTTDNRLVKKIAEKPSGGVSCTPYNDCSVIHPTIILAYNSFNNSSNYMYIDVFDRFYYIDSYELMPGSKVLIRGTVDALNSFADDILGSQQLITRSADTSKAEVKFSRIIDPLRPIGPMQFCGHTLNTNAAPIQINHMLQFVITTLGGEGKLAELPPEEEPGKYLDLPDGTRLKIVYN